MTINNNDNKKNNNDNKINRTLSLLDQGDSLSRFSNRTGTSADDGASRSNNWRDQWQSSKLSTGSRVESFPRAFTSSSDVLVLLLNQPICCL